MLEVFVTAVALVVKIVFVFVVVVGVVEIEIDSYCNYCFFEMFYTFNKDPFYKNVLFIVEKSFL